LVSSIYGTINNIDVFAMQDVIKNINKYKKLAFIGTQYGLDIAEDQKRRYMKSGKIANIFDYYSGSIASIEDNSLVFLISLSGKSKIESRITNFIKSYKKNCKIIFISSYPPIKNIDFIDYQITGIIHDNVDINEKEIPRHSRIICYTILDYIYCK
jgi:DNA-binding MurR/RpiR family transcriptional regulator